MKMKIWPCSFSLKILQWLPLLYRMKPKILNVTTRPCIIWPPHPFLASSWTYSLSAQSTPCRPFSSLNMISIFLLQTLHILFCLYPFALMTSFHLPFAFWLLTDFFRKAFPSLQTRCYIFSLHLLLLQSSHYSTITYNHYVIFNCLSFLLNWKLY